MTDDILLDGSYAEVMKALEGIVPTAPRRVPGALRINGQILRYMDLHSFYYQSLQILAQRLYAFSAERTDPYILDCGAHIGVAALFFSLNYPDGSIESFEADPSIAEALVHNVASFGLSNVTPHAKAVWVHDRGVSFDGVGDDSGHVGGPDGAIPSVRLADLIGGSRPVDLLKMDVEGGEYALFPDCAPLLGNVRRMVVECHHMQGGVPQLGGLLKIVEEAGFQYSLSDLHPAPWAAGAAATPFPAIGVDRFIVTLFAWR